MSDVRIAGVVGGSITDGPGIRYTIFTQGCSHNCPGCQNPDTHPYDGGYLESTEKLISEAAHDPMLTGVTFSGGEPFDQPGPLCEIALWAREHGLETAAYTGYLYEQLLEMPEKRRLLELCDVIVDGPFIMEQRNLDIRFKGSENQRIIDVPKSLECGRVILKEDGRWIASDDEIII